jgi:hypothetical protein
METPYKANHELPFDSPANSEFQACQSTPDLLKFFSPSLLLYSNKKDTTLSPIIGTSVFNIKREGCDINPLSIPEISTSNGTKKRTCRRLLIDSDQLVTSIKKPNNNNEDYLQKLQRNPMFEDLSKLLADECLHMQVPTNLINIKWDTKHNQANYMSNVHVAHLKLQKRFLRFRSRDIYLTQAREIECRYSKEVNQIEISRYLQQSAVLQDQFNIVHERFDRSRLQLIFKTNKSLDQLLLKENASRHKEMTTEQLLTTNSSIFEDSSLSSDNSTDPTVIGQYQDVDVLSLALAASDIFPEMTNLNQHNIYMVPKHIPSLLETFTLPRHDYVHSQQIVQPQIDDTVTQQLQWSSLKRKLEDAHQTFYEYQQQKKVRTDIPAPRQRRISIDVTSILTQWYETHVHYPYPTDDEVIELTNRTNLSPQQVKKWMANKRVRCFNTLSITGNRHPIKAKLTGRRKISDNSSSCKQLSDQTRQHLNEWYLQHINKPYPTDDEKKWLAQRAGITVSQVKSWFANKRSRAIGKRRQIPNYFLEKFPEFTSHVQMVQTQRDQSRRKCCWQRNEESCLQDMNVMNFQNSYF